MKGIVYRYNSIMEPDIIAVMEEIGIEVEVYALEMTEKDVELPTLVKKFGEYLLNHPVDFVFSINFFPHVSEICESFHIRYISWTVDSPVMELYTTSIQNSYNRTFLFDRTQYEQVHGFNPEHIFYQPLAARIEPKDQLLAKSSAADRKRFSHDIAFVGSLYTEKSPYRKVKNLPEETRGFLDGIMEAQKNVYGYYFMEDLLTDKIVEDYKAAYPSFYQLPGENFLTDRRTLSELYIGNEITAREREETFRVLGKHLPVSIYTGSDTSKLPVQNMGFAKSLTEMPIIFHQSKININTTAKSIQTGLPLRIFDIMSVGGFVLSNYQSEIPELFTLGQDLVCYTSMEELVELSAYYLEHEEERREIAACGRETLREKYSLVKVFGEMVIKAFSV